MKKEPTPFILLYSAFIFAVQHLPSAGQGVLFPGGSLQVGSSCTVPGGGPGTCLRLESCPEAVKRYTSQSFTHCYVEGLEVVVCCPDTNSRVPPAKPLVTPNLKLDISAPNITLFECGIFKEIHAYVCEDDITDPYRLNNILLDVQEANHKVLEVRYNGIFVSSLVWTDGQQEYNEYPAFAAIGGEPARRLLAQYMALLGGVTGATISWYCDGILINERWVLTAAHCMQSSRQIDVVRLGEYDYNNDTDCAQQVDFGIEEVVIYPLYQAPLAYHDLALLKLSRRVRFSRFINPICLPWENLAKQNLVDSHTTLTGWGATKAGGPGSSILQEVNITVFQTAVCDASYSALPFYGSIWPSGIAEGILCAGDVAGGKDACQGDSGGPIVFTHEDNYQYVLAGVVSKGQGCGSAEFPGLYTDITHEPYLTWIKEVAFSNN